ncbi:hypothetical protein CAOG_009312 [Capsaspora owczarzaki ATCC 30864]|uniref:Uncharacterized protein n=1 Tax=Capsaspora owczarzaki (strain ATCC 30864) TaxID=595528 RepID=A0A0D2X0E3_CAPO3|nr:hypothetical protein CAOG_009312 [Capsaspora owczarzaki ATCC 30864]
MCCSGLRTAARFVSKLKRRRAQRCSLGKRHRHSSRSIRRPFRKRFGSSQPCLIQRQRTNTLPNAVRWT